MPVRLVVNNEPSGEILKEEGIALSFKGIPRPFYLAYAWEVCTLPPGQKCITEEIRLRLEARGFIANHKNWWGTLASMCIRRGALVKTNPPEIWNAQDPDGHSRECRVHIRTGQL